MARVKGIERLLTLLHHNYNHACIHNYQLSEALEINKSDGYSNHPPKDSIVDQWVKVALKDEHGEMLLMHREELVFSNWQSILNRILKQVYIDWTNTIIMVLSMLQRGIRLYLN